MNCLKDDGSRNPAHVKTVAAKAEGEQPLQRGIPYDYVVQENVYPSVIGIVDEPLKTGSWATKDIEFPKIILVRGNKDADALIDLQRDVMKILGTQQTRLVVIEGAGHFFDDGLFWDGNKLEGKRQVWAYLDKVVGGDTFED